MASLSGTLIFPRSLKDKIMDNKKTFALTKMHSNKKKLVEETQNSQISEIYKGKAVNSSHDGMDRGNVRINTRVEPSIIMKRDDPKFLKQIQDRTKNVQIISFRLFSL